MRKITAILILNLICVLAGYGQNLDFQTVPSVIYKNSDGTKWGTESFFFNIVLTGSLEQKDINNIEVTVQLFKQDTLIKTEILSNNQINKTKDFLYTISNESPVKTKSK